MVLQCLNFNGKYSFFYQSRQKGKKEVLYSRGNIKKRRGASMGKSLAELEAAFQAQYPRAEIQKNIKKEKNSESIEVETKQEEYEDESTDVPRRSVFASLIFYFAFIAMLLCAVVFSGGILRDKTVGGFRLVDMSTPTMVGVYPLNSLLVIKEVPLSELRVGDDISFYQNSQIIITHRIAEVIEDYEESGERAFITRGVNDPEDEHEVTKIQMIGRVDHNFPQLGTVLSMTSGNMHYIVLAFIVLIIIMVFVKVLSGRRKN